MLIRVHVVPREGVLDPQGEAVAHGLRALGFEGVAEVRVGRVVDVTLPEGTDATLALERGRQMAKKLLANEIVEDFTVSLVD